MCCRTRYAFAFLAAGEICQKRARIYIISSLSIAKTYRICCKANISSRAKRRHIDKIKIASVDTEAVLVKKKDEKFQQFLVLFLLVGIFNFILLYRKHRGANLFRYFVFLMKDVIRDPTIPS